MSEGGRRRRRKDLENRRGGKCAGKKTSVCGRVGRKRGSKVTETGVCLYYVCFVINTAYKNK